MLSFDYLHINSCGYQDLYGIDTGSFRPRGRADYHLLYITEGVCFVNFNGKIVEAKAGCILLFLPYEIQDYRFKAEIRSRSYYIHFDGAVCPELFNDFTERLYYVGKNNHLEALFSSMTEEYRVKLLAWESACQGYLLNIISAVKREINMITSKTGEASCDMISRICRVMHSSYAKNVSVPEYASMCNLSESRFSHLFKINTGVSPVRYILNIRIEKACDLLENTDLSIASIAELTGMQSQHYLSRIFKKYIGMSPSDYRKKFQ